MRRRATCSLKIRGLRAVLQVAIPFAISEFVCLRTGVLECLDDESLHLDFTFVSLVSGHPRPPVVTAPVYRGCPCRDPLGCLQCPGRMASGAERQPLWCRWWWTCRVDVAYTRVLQAELPGVTHVFLEFSLALAAQLAVLSPVRP